MALPTFTTCLSALLCFGHLWAMPTPCHIKGIHLQNAVHLLRDMGGLFPPECLEDKVSITFPASAFATSGTPQLCGGAAKAIYETLKSIDWLFGTEDLPTKWDQQKLDDFQNIIYTQINHSQCIMKSAETSDYPAREVALKTYFGKIQAVQKEKNFSYCSWEIVRKEALETLTFILKKNSHCLLWPKRI